MKKLRVLGSAIVLAAAAVMGGVAQAAPPVEAFVQQDVFRGATMSPNGRYIAGVRNEAVGDVLVVIDWETKQTKAIQYARNDQNMQIGWVRFKGDDRVIFSVQQKLRVVQGDSESRSRRGADDGITFVSRVYGSNLDGSNLIPLYVPPSGDIPRYVSPDVVDTLSGDADHILLASPSIRGTQLRKVNVRNGEATIIESGERNTFSWIVDSNATPVLRQEVIDGGRGFAWSRRAPSGGRWIEVVRFRGEDGANSGPNFEGAGAAPGGPGRVYVLARPPGKDTSGIYIYDTATGQFVEEVGTNPTFDVYDTDGATGRRVSTTLTEDGRVVAFCYWAHKWTCDTKDETFARHWNGLNRAFGNTMNVRIGSRSKAAGRWLVRVNGPQDLGSFYIYNLASRSLDFVGGARPSVEPEQLPTQEVIQYTARDGTRLWGYLWVPPGAQNANNLPMIVLPHGGPESRDLYGRDPFAHWWAANGYLVFQPNYRGGGGSGRAFVEAGHKQWGQRMQQDMRDGAEHVVRSGKADRNRLCIAGWSYGGYATMAGSFIDGDFYKCAMAGAGVSDMVGMQRWTRSGDPRNRDTVEGGGDGAQSVSYQYWSQAMGDPSSDSDMMNRFSAYRNADKINMPLMLIHGDEDEIVPVEQSEIMADAMRRAGKTAELIILKDEGHQWAPMTVEGRRTVLVESLRFFQQHLGPGYSAARTN